MNTRADIERLARASADGTTALERAMAATNLKALALELLRQLEAVQSHRVANDAPES